MTVGSTDAMDAVASTDAPGKADAMFDIVRRGYDRAQVDERLNFLHDEIAEARRALAETEQRNNYLEDQLRAARAELAWRGHEPLPNFSDRVERILQLAEEEATEMRGRASTELADARSHAQEVVETADQAARGRQQAAERELAELHALRDDLVTRLGSVRELLTEHVSRGDAEHTPQDGEDESQRRSEEDEHGGEVQ